MKHKGWSVLATSALLIATAVATAMPASAGQSPVNGSVRTTVDEGADGTGHCVNGNPDVNCNIYDAKDYVWLSGQPLASGLADGQYMFAVLVPGGQADPNDGAADNLSDAPGGDGWQNRVFSVVGGVLHYSGTHDFDVSAGKIRLWPYDDTTNPGGVYTMAVCSLANAPLTSPGVNASDCKYDNFKVGLSSTAVAPAISKDAAGTYTRAFTWTIDKSVDQSEIKQSGTDATFNYTVTVSHVDGAVSDVAVTGTIDVYNPNPVLDPGDHGNDITGATITDTLSDGTPCAVEGGSNATLSPGDNPFDYTCTLSSLPQGELDNTASVAWDNQTLSAGALEGDSSDFTFSDIQFTQTAAVDDCTAVNDTYKGSLGTVCTTDPNPTEFTYPRDVTGTPGTCTTYDNTASFVTNTTGTTDSAEASAKLCVGADLTVSKTANPAFQRTYNWNITKQVDKTSVATSGDNAIFNYTVKANETGFTDGAWTVTGTITVTNPNDWESVTLTGVTDSIDNGGICSITSGDPTGTVAANDSVTLGYSCTYASKPNPAAFTNTATATWDATAANTPHGSASGTAGGAFGTTPGSTTNKTITVTDTYKGTLGTLTATDTTPYASKTFTYSRTVTVPGTGCSTFPNTATITETGQNASQSVQVCRTVSGGFTMGYWSNKNGQAQIAGAAAGLCAALFPAYSNVLTNFPSNCAAKNVLTGYVSGIISAANASGDGAPMFRGQFLATALSAYFNSKLAGTGVAVDPSVFTLSGGSSCMTVNQLLKYGNDNYPALSTGSKATFMAVKSVYDDINNNRAITC